MRDGRGYCPRCGREISIDLSLFGYCEEHGRVPANFSRPSGCDVRGENHMSDEPTYYVLDNPDPDNMTNPAWVALVSETDGGIIAVGQRDVIEATAEALNDRGTIELHPVAGHPDEEGETSDSTGTVVGTPPNRRRRK